MSRTVRRRGFVLGALSVPMFGTMAHAEAPTDLEWSDLLPEGESAAQPPLQGTIQHGGTGLAMSQPASTGLRNDWNGKTVRLPGYVVPLDYSGEGVTTFILVPYIGACIHVPPPPANQLVLVTSEPAYMSEGVFEPVIVTGKISTEGEVTDLAEVGYSIVAEKIDPFYG